MNVYCGMFSAAMLSLEDVAVEISRDVRSRECLREQCRGAEGGFESDEAEVLAQLGSGGRRTMMTSAGDGNAAVSEWKSSLEHDLTNAHGPSYARGYFRYPRLASESHADSRWLPRLAPNVAQRLSFCKWGVSA